MSQELPSVYLVRHGATAWSITRQHTGRTDIPLAEQGERDALTLRTRLHALPFGNVFTSPLQRSRRTCELAGFGDSMQVDPDLIEWDYGAYEGRRAVEIQAERPGWSLFEDGCPGGETLADVSVRAQRVIERIRALPGNTLLFAHGHILRVLAARWLDLPAIEGRRFYLATGSLSILGYDHDMSEPAVRLWNDAGGARSIEVLRQPSVK